MSDKFPRYLHIALCLYALSFFAMLGLFIVPAARIGLTAYADFYFYLLLMFLPLMLFLVYVKAGIGKDYGTVFRLSIVASTVILSLVFIFIIGPLL